MHHFIFWEENMRQRGYKVTMISTLNKKELTKHFYLVSFVG